MATAPMAFRLGAFVMALVAAVSTAFAIVVATVLQAPVGSLLGFAAWCATLALALGYGPGIWRSQVEYFVTEDQVVYQRGPFRRVIDRQGISYARIHWHPKTEGIGDLELVRAVPTGALRRRLVLSLPSVEAPDSVWALIRGAPTPREQDENLPIAQRLEEGERVLWSAKPMGTWRDYLPSEPRDWANLGLALLVLAALVRQVTVAVPVTKQVLAMGIPARSLPFVALLLAFVLATLLLASVALSLAYFGFVRPAQRWQTTRYLITNRRVLIQRGREELSLDRSRIVGVIDKPRRRGGHDLFLVLDGPRARGLATSGAFGQPHRKDSLVPVLRAILDPEPVGEILRERLQGEENSSALEAAAGPG